MARLMRSFDWSQTALGPPERWSTSLKTMVGVLLGNRFPMCLFWGPTLCNINNDAYRPILGDKHPASLGAPGAQIWAEIWHILGPQAERVLAGGPATWNEHLLLPMNRKGYVEETYFTFSYSPVPDDDGRVGGVLVTCQETTEQVQDARQLRMLQELTAHANPDWSPADACQAAARVLEGNPADVPCSMLYLMEDDGAVLTLSGMSGMRPEEVSSHAWRVPLAAPDDEPVAWPFEEALRTGAEVEVPDMRERLGEVLRARMDPTITRGLVLPLVRSGQARPWGFLVAGVSPRRALDERYRSLFRLAAERIASAVSNAHAYKEERKRVEALAQLDRAKTAFFSNVSHEFRTPLTLMLGHQEEALHSSTGALSGDALRAVYRNTLRLRKLVNTLLDFSRIEAGRAQACYRPVDLAQLTRDLASAFRSAIERGGLRFDVECPALPEPAYVDRDMWEKIVLNLVSNAFKFTLEGGVRVALRARPQTYELSVSDTGPGIPEHELPRLFERFHRIEGVPARTHEGSGIGLALVHELVRLHGGSISVQSRVGQGSVFCVSIPRGFAHLPKDRVLAEPSLEPTCVGVEPFVEEALRWLPDATASAAPTPEDAPRELAAPASYPARVLVVDDNADMRAYLTRLLEPYWQVQTACDGAQALALASARAPDLILTDVMMPNLDGFGLLRALRAAPATASIPVLMLSARAGEESRVEGLHAGADDYLVKPFSARELVARVRTHLELARARSRAQTEHEKLRRLLTNAPFAIAWMEGPEHRVVLSNPRHRALLEGKDVTGKPLLAALPELRGTDVPAILDRVYRTGEAYVDPELCVALERAGEIVHGWFNVVYEPVLDAAGHVEGVLGCAMEVTEHVLARRELEAAREVAETATRAKDEFLAMLGHELRNPLAPILTALHLLRLRGTQGRELDVIERQLGQLVRLVDDLLDISRITRGKVELRKRPIELSAVVMKGLEMASPLLEQRRQRVDIDVPTSGLRVHGDPDRLAQVVSNLLTNAAKYSEPSTQIRIPCARDSDQARLEVADAGIGIAPDMLGRIFDSFVQHPQALDRSRGGLGLGLTIVRSLVELHGGVTYARSAGPGKGSAFVVELPLTTQGEQAPEERPSAHGTHRVCPQEKPQSKRILIVDDNRDAAEAIAELLSELGYTVQVAHDGPTALQLARQFKPDVGLLDIGLPVMDGYELARQLRASGDLPAHLRLVAITGYGQEADRQRSKDAGFNAHIVKPVDAQALTEIV